MASFPPRREPCRVIGTDSGHPVVPDPFDFTVRGVRGTLPVSVPGGSVYGGNTSCILLRHGSRVAILDAGSGIVGLGRDLIAQGVAAVDIVLSHAHYDHVIGLPFFLPLYRSDIRVSLWYAGSEDAPDGRSLLAELIRAPFLPMGPSDLRCDLQFAALPASGTVDLGGGTQLTTCPVNHPGGAVGMRIGRGAGDLVYVPDFEHDDGPMDAQLVGWMQDAAIALLDCTFLPEDYAPYAGYGHSHWQKCASLAKRAGVGRMGMFHHNFTRTDDAIAAAEAAARQIDPAIFAAREGMVLCPERALA